jgi:para-aminobenzoate synthetase component 1
MESFSLENWQNWQREGFTRLPAVRVERAVFLPASWEGFTDAAATILLESANTGRFSYLCDRPARVIMGCNEGAEIWAGDCSLQLGACPGQPLSVLRSIIADLKVPKLNGWPAMTGGLMGVLGYDLVHTWERLPMAAKRDLAMPLYAMIEPRELFVYDHHDATLGIVVWCDVSSDPTALSLAFRNGEEAVRGAWARWQSGGGRKQERPQTPPPVVYSPGTMLPSFTPDEFRSAVRRALEYIAAGDTYQVNLSLRTSRAVSVPPETIYEALRRVNPSPYMGLLRLPEFALVCGSPELLVRLEDGIVSSRPIAGTRPRGDAAAQDTHFSAELLASEKERAEHLMLVDLIRNDIGRVAEFGSVHVAEFMALEHYSHVMHIVSQVEGRLAAGQTWVEVLQSMFPGGTITGCPKIRTIEIIEELEPVGRCFYTGALGWISYAGEMEMNIVIRSMLVQHGVAHVQAGAGIVADSQPDRELDEALRKAQALWVALDEATKHRG